MGLPRGWLAKGIQNITKPILYGSIQGGAQALGFDLEKELAEVDIGAGEVADAQVKAYSTLGGLLGAPLGFLPFLTTYYASGAGEIHSHQAKRTFETARIPPDIFATLLYRHYITKETEDEWRKDLKDQGWNDARINALVTAYRQMLGLSEIRQCYLRGLFGEGEIADREAIKRITALGFTPDDAEKIKELFWFIPPASDLISWVAKEVFEPASIEKYGLEDEFERLDLSLFRKVGISPDMARNYWIAHWQHASWTQVQEMLHRGIITEQDVWEWFRLVEIPPYWRDKLIKIAYTPYTRVDVRRMYREKVLSEEEVYQAYRDLGYDDTRARKLTEWTKKYYPPDDQSEDKETRDLTRSLIIRGYRDNILDRNTAKELLIGIDYSEMGAEFILAIEDYEREKKETEDTIEYIRMAYVAGKISDDKMLDMLGELNLSGERMERLTTRFKIERERKVARPSKEDLKRWLKMEIITEGKFREEMSILGYADDDISNYVREIRQSAEGGE